MCWWNAEGLTPAQEVIPVKMLLLCKHSYDDERVEVDAFTEHPEVIAAQHVHVEEVQHLTADLHRTVPDQSQSPLCVWQHLSLRMFITIITLMTYIMSVY